jgi:predicted HicB family RNase H-like nuclease
VAKSSEAEQARRVNVTISLLEQRNSVAEVLAEIVAHYGLSRRQAYRYLQQAQQAGSPLPVPERKAVFTVKLPRRLIAQVRRQARQQRCSISSWVEQALRVGLDQPKCHG